MDQPLTPNLLEPTPSLLTPGPTPQLPVAPVNPEQGVRAFGDTQKTR